MCYRNEDFGKGRLRDFYAEERVKKARHAVVVSCMQPSIAGLADITKTNGHLTHEDCYGGWACKKSLWRPGLRTFTMGEGP